MLGIARHGVSTSSRRLEDPACYVQHVHCKVGCLLHWSRPPACLKKLPRQKPPPSSIFSETPLKSLCATAARQNDQRAQSRAQQ
nr:hypothetical protein CFP56_30646 [Quercus suber]